MKRFIWPDWENSNLNISATFADFLGAKNSNSTLSLLKKELSKGYKNIVFICLDGCGINPLKINLDKNSFLRRNIKQTLTSTFPSTTTNATTSLICNKYPLEHGWLGWSLYFNDVNRNIDIYLRADSQTKDPIKFNYPISDNTDCFFDNVKTEYEINSVLPSYVHTKHDEKRTVIKDEFELCSAIKEICKKKGKQFIYSYLPEPDSTMHIYGVSSCQAKAIIESINSEIEKLFNSLVDTLIVISADHGQIDVEGYIEGYKDKELNDMLVYTPYLDARTPAFIVKNGKKKAFETLFRQRYGEDFKLYKSKDLIKKGFFGKKGEYGYLLGDYIGIGTYTHKLFLSYKEMTRFKGHHTSLTEEMEVPLIILAKKDN